MISLKAADVGATVITEAAVALVLVDETLVVEKTPVPTIDEDGELTPPEVEF